MLIRLGYVAISNKLNITSSSSITYTNYCKLSDNEKINKLDLLCKKNLDNLYKILKYNLESKIYFYRMSSNIFPLFTHPSINYNYLSIYKCELETIGKFINKNKMRVDIHLDQFCVLNSVNKDVVDATIKIINLYSKLLDILDINGKMIIHIGSSSGGINEALKRFKNNFKLLSSSSRDKIVVENDDKIFTAFDTVKLCEELNVPMVLDYHHFLCNNNGENILEIMDRFVKTWGYEKIAPKLHFSSPKSIKEFRSHNDYIDVNGFIKLLNILKKFNVDVDIMLEAKEKDLALLKLVSKLKKRYKFVNNSTFFI